ncbi:L,D-transpeptidase catalytic domain containing protein [Candidatus Pelagibacterales bacterium]
MIIINKSGHLTYKNLKFKCTLGKAGINVKKKEGDNITPLGTYKISKVYYRKDRIKKLFSKLKLIEIKKSMAWCDDSKSKNYNKLIKLPSKFSHEKLFRKDKIYDLIIPLNYNTKNIKKNKGSAIFIHVANKKFTPTKGCIALKKEDLICLIKNIKNNKIKILKN